MLRPELPTMRDTSCSCNDRPSHLASRDPGLPKISPMRPKIITLLLHLLSLPFPHFFTGRETEAQWKESASPGVQTLVPLLPSTVTSGEDFNILGLSFLFWKMWTIQSPLKENLED